MEYKNKDKDGESTNDGKTMFGQKPPTQLDLDMGQKGQSRG